MTPDDHRQRLTKLRGERYELTARLAGLENQISYAARNATLASLTKVEVAKLLGISRPTLYKILDQ